jgi:hypothetical protein
MFFPAFEPFWYGKGTLVCRGQMVFLIYLLKFFRKRPIFRNRDIDGLSSADEKV